MPQAQTLSEAQLKRALTYCNSRRHARRDQTIILLTVYAGLRAKEVAALQCGTVYDTNGTVRDAFVMSGDQTKGGRARTVYVSRKLARALQEYRSDCASRAEHEPLFITQQHSAFSANTMCQLMLDIYKGCGLAHASSHSGRRTFITRLAEQGVNVRLLAELAGHSSITTTQRYIDANPAQLARAVELV